MVSLSGCDKCGFHFGGAAHTICPEWSATIKPPLAIWKYGLAILTAMIILMVAIIFLK